MISVLYLNQRLCTVFVAVSGWSIVQQSNAASQPLLLTCWPLSDCVSSQLAGCNSWAGFVNLSLRTAWCGCCYFTWLVDDAAFLSYSFCSQNTNSKGSLFFWTTDRWLTLLSSYWVIFFMRWVGGVYCVCVCSFQVQWSLDIRSPSWSRWLGWVVCFGRSASTAWIKMSGIAGRFGTAVLSVIWLVNTFPLLSRASRTHTHTHAHR